MSAHIPGLSLIFETYSQTSCLPEAFHLRIMGIIIISKFLAQDDFPAF